MKQTYARAASCLGLTLLSALPSPAKEPATAAPRGEASAARAATAHNEAQHRTAPAAEPATTAAPPPTPAAEPPPADLTEQAKQLYLLGAEAFAAQRNADAIYYFRQAERLVPSAKLTYNVALAYDEMGDTGRALREYRAFLAREPNSLHSDEARARISKLELALAALGVQQLSVASDPPGATLSVDDDVAGVTPWTGELVPGVHHIQLGRAGYRTQETHVTLGPQRAADVQMTLLPQAAPEAKAPGILARIQPLSWSFLGVGLGALAGGLAFELSRASSSDRAGRASTAEAAARAQGAADAKQMASLLLFGAGGAFVVGGGVLIVLDLNRDAERVAAKGNTGLAAGVSLPCARDFCGLVTRARF